MMGSFSGMWIFGGLFWILWLIISIEVMIVLWLLIEKLKNKK